MIISLEILGMSLDILIILVTFLMQDFLFDFLNVLWLDFIISFNFILLDSFIRTRVSVVIDWYVSFTFLTHAWIPLCYPTRGFMKCSWNCSHYLSHLRDVLVLVRLVVEGFLFFLANYLSKICLFAFSLIWMVLVCMSLSSCTSCTPIGTTFLSLHFHLTINTMKEWSQMDDLIFLVIAMA